MYVNVLRYILMYGHTCVCHNAEMMHLVFKQHLIHKVVYSLFCTDCSDEHLLLTLKLFKTLQ